jgi:hypothetical protein
LVNKSSVIFGLLNLSLGLELSHVVIEGFFQHSYKVWHLAVYKFSCFTINNNFDSVPFTPVFHRELLLVCDLVKIPSGCVVKISSLQGSLIGFIKISFKVFVKLLKHIVNISSCLFIVISVCFIVLHEFSIVYRFQIDCAVDWSVQELSIPRVIKPRLCSCIELTLRV